MGMNIRALGILAVMSFGIWTARQSSPQEKPAATSATTSTKQSAPATAEKPAEKSVEKKDATATTATSPVKKNPLKPTPEVLASGRKVFGYDCAMCHGEKGDGKGEIVESMKLTMKDWHDPAVLSSMSDGEMYDLIVTGKDKMVGEGDRLPPAKVWALVLYARTFAKK
jgi:mono/diheme cytochrome c family protein